MRPRRMIWLVSALACVAAAVWWFSRVGDYESAGGPELINEQPGSPGPILQGSPRPDDQEPEGETIPVNVACEGPSEQRFMLVVWAGTSFTKMTRLASIECGTSRLLRVRPDALYWYADLEAPDWRYEPAAVTLKQLAAHDRVDLVIRRASGILRATAVTPDGEPVGLVQLELAHANDPRPTRRLTDADGKAEWTGIRPDLMGADAIRVSSVPSGMSVVQAPTTEPTIEEGPAGGAPATVSYRLVLANCNSRLRSPVADVRTTTVICERWAEGAWEGITRNGYVDVVPETVSWDDAAPPIDSDWASDGSAMRGYVRGAYLCPGRYRLTQISPAVGVIVAEVVIRVRDEVVVQDYQELPSTRIVGTLTGPATGRAKWGLIQVLSASEAAARFKGAKIRFPFRADGSFEATVPEGVLSYCAVVAPSNEPGDAYWVLPEVLTIGREAVLQSVEPGSAAGRLVDASARPMAEIPVSAQVEPVDSRGRVLSTPWLVPVRAVKTAKDGTWELGAGPPGVWNLIIQPSPDQVQRRRFIVRAGIREVVGDVEIGPVPEDR